MKKKSKKKKKILKKSKKFKEKKIQKYNILVIDKILHKYNMVKLQMYKFNKMSILGEICTMELERINKLEVNVDNLTNCKDPIEEDLPTMNYTTNEENTEKTRPLKTQNQLDIKNIPNNKHHEIITIDSEEEEIIEIHQPNTKLIFRPLIKHTTQNLYKTFYAGYTEDARRATSLSINRFEFGSLSFEVIETRFVRKISKQKWSISRKTGKLIITIDRKTIPYQTPTILRVTLARKNPTHRHQLINEICSKHQPESNQNLIEHVMQTNNRQGSFWYDTTGTRKSICFKTDNTNNTIISLSFLCTTSCNTTGTPHPMTKKSKGMLLILTLEQEEKIISRRSLEIYPTDRMKKKTDSDTLSNAIQLAVCKCKLLNVNKSKLFQQINEAW